jgi:hypothetical protein
VSVTYEMSSAFPVCAPPAGPAPGHVAAGAQGPFGHGSGARCHVDAEPDGVRRHDDVAVEHRGVDAVATDRLHRDLGGELGLLDRIEDRPVTADRPVLG